jgi:hypothetical protein
MKIRVQQRVNGRAIAQQTWDGTKPFYIPRMGESINIIQEDGNKKLMKVVNVISDFEKIFVTFDYPEIFIELHLEEI